MKWGCNIVVSAVGYTVNIQLDCWLKGKWRSVSCLLTEMWWDHCAPSWISELHPVPGYGQLQRPWKYHVWNQGQVFGKWKTLTGFFFQLMKTNSVILFLHTIWYTFTFIKAWAHISTQPLLLFCFFLSGKRTTPPSRKWRSGSGLSLWC